jgi:hypothetical protein
VLAAAVVEFLEGAQLPEEHQPARAMLLDQALRLGNFRTAQDVRAAMAARTAEQARANRITTFVNAMGLYTTPRRPLNFGRARGGGRGGR